MSDVNMLDEHSPMVKRIKKISLDYYSNLASLMMMRGDMSDEDMDKVNDMARAIAAGVIDRTNAIKDVHERIAVAAIVVFSLAMSTYLTIDQALVASMIDEDFGGGDE